MSLVYLLPSGSLATSLGGTDNGLFSIDGGTGIISRTGTLTSGTTYNVAYLVYDTATGLISGKRDTITAAAANPAFATPMLVDTDIPNDCDDAGAFAVLSGLALTGEANIIAATLSVNVPFNAEAARALLSYAGVSAPIGASPLASTGGNGGYGGKIAQDYSWFPGTDTNASYPAALTVLRQALASSSRSDNIINAIGGLSNIAALLQSPADGISSMTGFQLVAAKVARICIMGGNFDAQQTEFNIELNRASAAYVAANSPVDLYWNTFNNGSSLPSGPASGLSTSTNIYRDAYTAGGYPDTRDSFDPLNSLFAIRPGSSLFTVSVRGNVSVDTSTGFVAFTAATGGKSFVVRLASGQASNASSVLNGLMANANMPSVVPATPVVSIPTANIADTNVTVVPDRAPGAFGYDYSLNGGTTVVSLPGTGLISGLTASTTYSVIFRAKRLGQVSPWSAAVGFTTTAAFTPAQVFAGNGDGAFIQLAPGKMFSDLAGTSAAVVGGPVGFVADSSGNGINAVAISNNDRYTLRQTAGGNYYLQATGSQLGYRIGTTRSLSFANVHAFSCAYTTNANAGYQTTLMVPAQDGAHVDPYFYWGFDINGTSVAARLNGVDVGAGPYTLTTPRVFEADATAGQILLDGAVISTLSPPQPVQYPNASTARFGSNGGGGEPLVGCWFGAVVRKTELTTAQAANVRAWFNKVST